MKSVSMRWLVVAVCVGLLGTALMAQVPGRPGTTNRRPPGQPGQQAQRGGPQGRQGQEEEAPKYKPPEEPRLLEIHKQFVMASEKLANELVAKNQMDKARECYEGILRLAPDYPPAKEGLEKINQKEASADKRVLDVYANKGWQDSGVKVEQGRPLAISSSGSWKIMMSYDLTADGIEIPPELRDFNIGSLVGMIDDGTNNPDEVNVFFIGSQRELKADKSGRLMLRMYDADPQDNVGKVSVTIQGTFAK